jgi:uncharacterized cupin superfamily protein
MHLMSQPVAFVLIHADDRPGKTPPVAAGLGANDPFADVRQSLYFGDDGIAAGRVEMAGAVTVPDYPFSEMLVVHRGQVSLRSEALDIDLGPGHSAVIGRGTQLRIEARPGSLWAFCAATRGSGPNKPGITPIERRAALTPSLPPEASVLVGPTPQCRSNNLFEDTASTLRIGVWDSTPYTRTARPHKVHELMHVLEGEVTLKQADGPALEVKTGDTVFVVQGAPCAWVSTVYVRKYYAVT